MHAGGVAFRARNGRPEVAARSGFAERQRTQVLAAEMSLSVCATAALGAQTRSSRLRTHASDKPSRLMHRLPQRLRRPRRASAVRGQRRRPRRAA